MHKRSSGYLLVPKESFGYQCASRLYRCQTVRLISRFVFLPKFSDTQTTLKEFVVQVEEAAVQTSVVRTTIGSTADHA